VNETAPRRSRWSAMLRTALEFFLLFAATMAAKELLSGASTPYPNLLWLPVMVLALQHGLAAGLLAALIAAALQYAPGLPAQLITEDMYSYIGRIAAEPIGWTCLALLFGHMRSRQIANSKEHEAKLAERSAHAAAVAELCVDLRHRIETLERHVAANAHASNADVVEALRALQRSGWDDFVQSLTRFVTLMTGSSEFTIHLLRDNALKPVLRPADDHRPAFAVGEDDPLFAPIVHERRIVSVSRAADHALLAARGLMAGPLMESGDRVIGMFALGGDALNDHPDDMERRFGLICSELALLSGRIGLIERWQAATPGKLNGYKSDVLAQSAPQTASPASHQELPPPSAPEQVMTVQ
jgi:hypothetical protein